MAVAPVPVPPPPGSYGSSATSLSSTGTAVVVNAGTTAVPLERELSPSPQYVSPQFPPPTGFSTTGEYLDVALSPGNSFTSVTIVDCLLNGGQSLQWYNPQAVIEEGGRAGAHLLGGASSVRERDADLVHESDALATNRDGVRARFASSCAARTSRPTSFSASYAKGSFTGLFCVNAEGVGASHAGNSVGVRFGHRREEARPTSVPWARTCYWRGPRTAPRVGSSNWLPTDLWGHSH